MARIKENLTNEEKVEIIKGAQKLLGPKGENWIKGKWFGKKTKGFSVGAKKIQINDSGIAIQTFWEVKPDEADSWCVLGALEESAYRLGYSTGRRKANVLGGKTSLKKLALEKLRKKDKWFYSSDTELHVFNDREKTTWPEMKKLLNERIKQLQAGEE